MQFLEKKSESYLAQETSINGAEMVQQGRSTLNKF